MNKWLRDVNVKFFTLLSALFLWFYVVTDNRFEHVLQVPLRLSNQPDGWILTRPVPEKVRVKFRGTGKELLGLGYRNKWIDLDLGKNTRPAKIPITLHMIKGVPSGSAQQIVGPDSVFIELDHFASKKVAVRSNLKLDPLDGYVQVGRVDFDPDSILISGPRSLVNQIADIQTVEKTYHSVMKKMEGKIDLATPEWETVHFDVSTVVFNADIQRIGERSFSDIPVQIIGVPRNRKVTVVPSTLSLKLQGGVRILSGIEKEDIVASIDFPSRSRYSGNQIPAKILVPDDISFVDVKPQFFEFIIER